MRTSINATITKLQYYYYIGDIFNIFYFGSKGNNNPCLIVKHAEACHFYEVCLKSIGTVCFAQTTLATVIKALFFKMAQCLVVVKM